MATIKTGLSVGWENDFPSNGPSGYVGFQTRWDRFRNLNFANTDPNIYHDFYDDARPGIVLKNYDNVDIFGRLASLDTATGNEHSPMLTFNVVPGANNKDADMTNAFGGTYMVNGFTVDEHVAMIGKALNNYVTGANAKLVRVRYLHEFTGKYAWCAVDEYGNRKANWSFAQYKLLWERWTRILEGGSIADINTEFGTRMQNLHLDESRLYNAGYDISSGELAANTRGDATEFPQWSNVWCGQSDPIVPNAGEGTNDYIDYYPTNAFVNYVSTDIYANNNSGSWSAKLANLQDIYDLANNSGKLFGISEFSRAPNTTDYAVSGKAKAGCSNMTAPNDATGPYQDIFNFARDHVNSNGSKFRFMVAYELFRSNQCLDYLITEPLRAGGRAYPNHLQAIRNRWPAESWYENAL